MQYFRLLYFEPGTQAWKELAVSGESFSIGQAPGNNLTLADVLVSPQHAYLHIDARGVLIFDQHSAHGVTIRGARIAPGQWTGLPLNENFIIGATHLRLEALAPATAAPGPVAARPKRKNLVPLSLGALLLACACLVGGGAAAAVFVPGLLPLNLPALGLPTLSSPATQPAPVLAPPTVIDSLAAADGTVQDEHGASLEVPAEALPPDQVAYLERASLSVEMQQAIEAAYQVESLAYAVRLTEGLDGTGRVALALPAPSPDSRLAVLVDDRWLGILETPVQDGVLRLSASLSLAEGVQTYPAEGEGAAQAPNRYLVVTPKAGATAPRPRAGGLLAQPQPFGQSCVSEFWATNNCWRNPEGTVYVFWENDAPANLNGPVNDRVIDTIRAVARLLGDFQTRGFTGAAISTSNIAYVIVEASATEPYYSPKVGNVYVPWDMVGGVGESKHRCPLSHEFFHWIEDEEYVMGSATNAERWWLEVSAEVAAFMLDASCIENNLTQYGIVNTNKNVLGFQAAPLQWESGDQSRYIHALQLYVSICEGGANCVISEAGWINAINAGSYPLALEGAAQTAYRNNTRDLGRFLLGVAPVDSRAAASIPPSAVSGNRFGDYLTLQTSPRGNWDYGLTMNQFTRVSDQQVRVEAKIDHGAVYPLWVSNGTRTPMGDRTNSTGLPGLLEILAGPGFWLKLDQAEPIFYPAGTTLKVGPISDKLGTGAARIVAIAPASAQTFQATLTLVDLAGDWSASRGNLTVTPTDCEGYSASEDPQAAGPDTLLQYFSGYGMYVRDAANPASPNLTWQGTLPDNSIGTSEVTVATDRITLHYHVEIPKPTPSGPLFAGLSPRPAQAARPILWGMLGPVLPGLALVAWQRRRVRQGGLGQSVLLVALIVAAFGLTGCVEVWGSLDATYTFDKLAYVTPPPAAAGATPAQPTVTWNLTNGQMRMDVDLNISSEVTNSEGVTVVQTDKCVLSVTSTATGTIGPADSVVPPES